MRDRSHIILATKYYSGNEEGIESTTLPIMSKKPTEIVLPYPTPALEKGLDILELLASEPTGLTKSEVARRLGRTISEIFRMLVCLEERGYIAQSPDSDRYHLTLYLFRLAREHPPIKRMTMQ